MQTDVDLVVNFQNGDDNAFTEILKRYRDDVYNFILSMLNDRSLADDLFQDTCFNAIRALRNGKYNHKGHLKGWLVRIAANLCIDHFRKLKISPQGNLIQPRVLPGNEVLNILDKFEDDRLLNPEIELLSKEGEQVLWQFIEKLPAEQKQVVLMRLDGLSFKEIKTAQSASINTSLARMRYARINLNAGLQKVNALPSA